MCHSCSPTAQGEEEKKEESNEDSLYLQAAPSYTEVTFELTGVNSSELHLTASVIKPKDEVDAAHGGADKEIKPKDDFDVTPGGADADGVQPRADDSDVPVRQSDISPTEPPRGKTSLPHSGELTITKVVEYSKDLPKPATVSKGPAPESKPTTPVSKGPATVYKQPDPASKQHAPVSKQPAPASKQPAPASKQLAPASKQPAPVSEQSARVSKVQTVKTFVKELFFRSKKPTPPRDTSEPESVVPADIPIPRTSVTPTPQKSDTPSVHTSDSLSLHRSDTSDVWNNSIARRRSTKGMTPLFSSPLPIMDDSYVSETPGIIHLFENPLPVYRRPSESSTTGQDRRTSQSPSLPRDRKTSISPSLSHDRRK